MRTSVYDSNAMQIYTDCFYIFYLYVQGDHRDIVRAAAVSYMPQLLHNLGSNAYHLIVDIVQLVNILLFTGII